MTDRYINAREIAKMLNVSRATVYNWLKRGKLPEGKIIGFARRWSINELQAFWNRDNNHEGFINMPIVEAIERSTC